MFFRIFQRHPGPRGQRAALVLSCLLLTLSLALGQAAAGLTVPGDAAATHAAALRAQVAAAGWVTVRVELRASASAARAAADDLEQTAQDPLFALPAGSYDTVARAAGSASLTLRVDAAGLDALLLSPWAVSVAAADTPEMQRLAVGFDHSLALKPDGSLWAWGDNWYGQLGNATTLTAQITPVQVLTGVAAVAAGEFCTQAIKTDGSLWAWGSNDFGQLGDGTHAHRSTPVRVLTGVAAVAAGDYHSLAIKTDGSLWAWGANGGQLGDGTSTNRSRPVKVLTGVAAVAAGGFHSLALKTDGSLWVWGNNGYGQLGDGNSNTTRLTPVQVLTGVAAVATGSFHSLALKTDGSLWAWGANWGGQIGDGGTTHRMTPVQVLTGVAAVSGADHTLARKTDGSLWAWGRNDYYGQLGDGTTTDRLSPVPVVGFGGLPPDADFTVTNVTLNPSAPLAGGTFNAWITVKNRGTQAGSPGLLRVWANQSQTQACDAPGDTEINLADLAAGANQRLRISLPAGIAGYKTLRTFIDSQCQIAEPNEANNQVTKGYRVFAQPIADFGVTTIDLTPNRPAANGTFSAAVTVKNRGTAPGDAGTLALWVDQPGVPTCGAAGDAAVAVGTLANGASHTLTFDNLPAGAAGAKLLRAFVDHTCVNTEAYDANNQRGKPYTVVP
ncbi:CARDB domain-containing protein [uncultured Lamprocystis sp.]|jgi:hypothetical protein|uniref:RCC1 domain-containing protein n=1 Tax=uncultured Lamprocystis sp. TaxID=543132 RepID=UPI0025F8456A|nr:CARDB domain-containing protein [uncultured Lamprocystis sp.]